MLPAAVAAGHPATAAAGVEILGAGGTAADAAVAASLASCVAETVMTGLLGGAHAIYWDSSARVARNLDCFVAVPSRSVSMRRYGALLSAGSSVPITGLVPRVETRNREVSTPSEKGWEPSSQRSASCA